MAILTRRRFLLATGWAGGATAVYLFRQRAAAVGPTIIFPNQDSAAAWLQIRPDGVCQMYFPRMEMGQNVNTGLAQVVAEELNLQTEDIHGVTPNTSQVPPIAFTAGSLSMTLFSRPTAIAAAALRESTGSCGNEIRTAPGGATRRCRRFSHRRRGYLVLCGFG